MSGEDGNRRKLEKLRKCVNLRDDTKPKINSAFFMIFVPGYFSKIKEMEIIKEIRNVRKN